MAGVSKEPDGVSSEPYGASSEPNGGSSGLQDEGYTVRNLNISIFNCRNEYALRILNWGDKRYGVAAIIKLGVISD